MMQSQAFLIKKVKNIQKGKCSIGLMDLFIFYNINRPDFAGPMNLSVCISFIILGYINATDNEVLCMPLDSVIELLSKSNADIGDEMDQLQKLAQIYFLHLYICIINHNKKGFYFVNPMRTQEDQQQVRSCLVFDKNNRSFYAFYVHDNNQKKQTIFPLDDAHTLRSFEDLVDTYNWPSNINTNKEISHQDIVMTDPENDEEESVPAADFDRSIGL